MEHRNQKQRKIQQMRYRTGIGVLVLTSAMLFAGGCGSAGVNYINQGMNSAQSADYQAALNYFDEAQKNHENQELIYRGQGISYLGMTDYDQAIEAFLNALSCSDGVVAAVDYDINYYLATAYYKSGAYQEAYDTYSSIIAMKKKEATAYYLRGVVALAMGGAEQAVADFDKAISLNKTDYSMYIDIYVSLDEKGYTEQGLGYLEKAMTAGSKTMSDYDKGRICYYMGDYENACVYLDNANKISSSEDIVLFLGKAYEATGDVNFAASIYLNYLSNYGDNAQIYNQLGLCKLSIKDYQAALDAFESGIAMNNMDIMQTLKYNELVAYEYLGDFKKACVLMETYLAAYPDDQAALREYEFLKTR